MTVEQLWTKLKFCTQAIQRFKCVLGQTMLRTMKRLEAPSQRGKPKSKALIESVLKCWRSYTGTVCKKAQMNSKNYTDQKTVWQKLFFRSEFSHRQH